MSLSQAVVDGFYLQASLVHESLHIVGMVHLAVTVGHCGEVQRGHREAESCWFKALAVPECFHDEEAGVGRHNFLCTGQDTDNFLFAEAV